MSVAVRVLGSQNFEIYAKGSPEIIAALSKQETVPENFQTILNAYTKQGYRVLAIAHKALSNKISFAKVNRISR